MVETLKTLQVGVDLFDEQHAELANMLTYFKEELKKDCPKSCLLSMIGLMIEKARVHLDSEEELMFELRYPGTKEHIIKHEEAMTIMSNFKRDYEQDLPHVNLHNFIDDLCLWLKMHIKAFDTPYNSFLRENGY